MDQRARRLFVAMNYGWTTAPTMRSGTGYPRPDSAARGRHPCARRRGDPLGSDAYEAIRAAPTGRLAELDGGRRTALSTDFTR
jgi:hypothetical protein